MRTERLEELVEKVVSVAKCSKSAFAITLKIDEWSFIFQGGGCLLVGPGGEQALASSENMAAMIKEAVTRLSDVAARLTADSYQPTAISPADVS